MTDPSSGASGSGGFELDVDGDGVADVMVPGLPSSPPPTAFDRDDTSPYLNLDEANLPPITSALSPMGRIEHQGYALRNAMSRPSWRRTVIKAGFWVFAAVIAALILTGLLQ
jgi:hypothetical protein